MLNIIIHAAIKQRALVLFLALVLVGVGVWSYQHLPIDAVPDITNVQVQINTGAEGYSPLEAEQRITFPVETVMAGLPELEQVRSLSRYGLSQVTVVFEDGTDLYFARQQVAERLQQVTSQLPAGLDPQLGPIATGLGEEIMEPPVRQLRVAQEARIASRRVKVAPFLSPRVELRREQQRPRVVVG